MSSQQQQQTVGSGANSGKEIVIDLSGEEITNSDHKNNLFSSSYLLGVAKLGATSIIVPSGSLSSSLATIIPENMKAYSLIQDVERIDKREDGENPKATRLTISSSRDIATAITAATLGADAIIAETHNWKVIPLENLVAELHAKNAKIFATISDPNEIETLFGVLEVGVDGVVVSPKLIGEVSRVRESMSFIRSLNLTFAEVTSVQEVGNGERVCVDTTSLLKEGESLLVGNKSNFLFAIHNEGIGSAFSAPRPFRVNAGAIHSYVLLPNGKTSYLSEMESGTRVLVVDREGKTRVATVGRSKIERRPLTLVKAISTRKTGADEKEESSEGSVIVQNAETIRFVGEGDSRPISVTDLKKGDRVLVYSTGESTGRHFGTTVDEYILEK